MEVQVAIGEKKWYEFITSVLAIVGGAFTVMGMLQGVSQGARKVLKGSMGKLL